LSDTREFRIYISSTIDDLVAERAEATEIIVLRWRLIDSYRVTEEAHEQNRTERVCQACRYIGLVGHRYGWVPHMRTGGTL